MSPRPGAVGPTRSGRTGSVGPGRSGRVELRNSDHEAAEAMLTLWARALVAGSSRSDGWPRLDAEGGTGIVAARVEKVGAIPLPHLLAAPSVVPVLGHAGAGATWQALLVLLSFGTVAIFALAVAGRLVLDEPGDLVLPLAGSAVLASLSGATAGFFSDWVGWWFPLGAAALVAVVVAASTRWSLGPTSPLATGAVVVGLVAAVVLHTTIEDAWHHTGDGVGARWTDAQLALVTPTDGQDIAVGEVEVVVAVQGGTIGSGPATTAPDDPEEGGIVRLYVDGRLQADPDGQPLAPVEDCTPGCAQATYTVALSRGVHVLSLEFLAGDGQSFDTPQGQSPTVQIATVEAG